ncbi:hypothetical protein F511_15587 [Dorcoceras hygrometricum]|uniref:Uncharacterized protein n=1 Tax=Dorcoceras hygrometricum TaxID=472368 RepID=A0A2Z7B4N0_9LAMI|nr:hypothetical protein F511_15587 [Dorcoceras hygrometricum]
MVHEYKTLSHTFEEIKAENASLKNSSAESSSDELEDTDSLKTELSRLKIENELLRNEASELKAEVDKLTKEMSSWNQSTRSLHKLNESLKQVYDKSGIGFSSGESSEGDTSTQPQLVYDKFNKMSFVKANVIYDCFESVTYDDQNSPKLSENGKAGIGFSKPESSKPNWLKNKLDKDKAKAGQKPFVPNQQWRSSKKVKTGWKNTQPRRDSYGQNVKPKLNKSHRNYAQTFVDPNTGKTVKVIQVWVPKGIESCCISQLQVTCSGGTVDNQSEEATYVGGTSRKIPVTRYQSQDTNREVPVSRCQSQPVIETISGIESSSSGASTVYQYPSPISPEVDSFENDLRFALGPAIFSSVEQEERFYFVQSPESPPAASPHQESSSSSTDVSLHFDSADIPVHDQAATQASAPVDFSMFTDALEDLRSSLAQRILDSNYEILSKVNAVELGVRGDLLKLQVLLRQSLENACQVLERQGTTQATRINDLKKGLMAPVGTIFQDLFDINKKKREKDAKLTALDGQIAAIRSEQLDFQSKIAADVLSLSTQVGDIADYMRGGVAKKGEIGSSIRPSTVRTQTLPPTTGTFAERAEQARRHIIESGQVITIEEATERVIEADRRESDRLERERARERRERRQSRSGAYKRRRG